MDNRKLIVRVSREYAQRAVPPDATPRMRIPSGRHETSLRHARVCNYADWVGRRRTLALGWGLPSAALVCSLFVESPWRAWIWVPSLLCMGAACLVNAIRCGRTHCYFTAPLFFVMACVGLLDGLGLLALGPRAWTWLGDW
jgi:hypothetical protein